MPKTKPLIGVIDWAKSPLGDPEPAIERSVIGSAAVGGEPLENVVNGVV